MKNLVKVILFTLTGLLLFSSMFQETTHLWDFKKLNGVEIPSPKPSLTYQNYRDGGFQVGIEAFLKQNFGFREPLIRFYNQYLWDFYKTSNGNQGILTIGKDGWLYEPWVVNDYYQTQFHYHAHDAEQMKQMLSEEAFRVYQLQHILEPYGCHLFTTLVPSKDLIYPEHLPDKPTAHFQDTSKMAARFYYEDELTRFGVNHINLEHFFVQAKDSVDFMLFPQTGTHWSEYGALFAADTLIRYMEHLSNINMKNIVIGPRTLQDADEVDKDLESLLNLIRPLPRPKYYYATVTTDNDSSAVKPKMITIGDSFWWNITNQLPMQDIFSAAPYWYYNSTIYFDNTYHSVDEVNLVDEIFSADFINLFYSATQLYRMNNNFTKKALLALCYDTEEIALTITTLEKNICADSAWAAKLRQRALSQGETFEEVVKKEAQWLINNEPEKFFPELNDTIPTKRSKQVEAYFTMDSLAFIEQEVEKTIKNIENNEAQLEAIREKAQQQGKTLEQAIRDDARWVVNYKLEHGTLQIPKTAKKRKQI